MLTAHPASQLFISSTIFTLSLVTLQQCPEFTLLMLSILQYSKTLLIQINWGEGSSGLSDNPDSQRKSISKSKKLRTPVNGKFNDMGSDILEIKC